MNSSQSQNCGDASCALPPASEPSAAMRVFTYASGSEDLPAHERAIARIKCPQVSGFGKTRAVRDDWHPVIFHAATQADAGAKAIAWWAAEIERERAKTANAAKRADAMKSRAAIAKATAQ